MAITARAVGAWAANNATTQTVTLPTHAAGDMLILRTIRKPFTSPDNTVCNTSGWAAVGTGVANGSTANGVGVGSMGFKAFWKIATSAAETNPVVTWGTTAAPGASVAVSYQKAATEAWVTPTGTGGGDATARTSQTSTMSSHISVTVGDLVDFFRGQCDDSGALTVPTITQTSVTYDAVTEYPAAALLDGTSNDIAADGGYRTATAGTSSAAAVITGTSAASEEHGAWMTRLRVNKLVTLPILGTGTAAYTAEVLADTPIAYWKLGEASGNPQDSSGNAHHVTAVGGSPTYGQTGPVNGTNAVAFNGTDQTFTAPSDAAYDVGDVFTLEAWVIPGATGASRGILCLSGGQYLRIINTAELTLTDSGVGILVRSTVNPSAGAWHHVVATKNGATVKLYMDGVDVTGTVTNSTFGVFTGIAHIAESNVPNERFNGSIGQVAVYSTALSSTRVLAHYTVGIGNGDVAALYAPSLTQTAANITVPLLDAAPALYAPTLASAAQAITLGLLDAAPALYAPTLATVNTLTIGLLTSTSDLYAPALVGKNTLTLGTVDAANAVYAPTLTVGAVTLTVPHLDAGSAVYAPTLIPGAVTLTIPNLDAANAVYAPTLATVNTLTLGLLDAGSAVYAPAVIPDQLVTVPHLDASGAVYAPTLTVGAVTLTIPLLDSGPAVYQPIVSTGEIFVDLAFIDASRAVYAPALTQTSPAKSVTLGLLTSSRALYAPSLELTGEQPLESGGLSIFDLRLVYRAPSRQKMRLPVLVSRATSYQPVVVVDDDAEVFELLALA